jgi:hypothetical protein
LDPEQIEADWIANAKEQAQSDIRTADNVRQAEEDAAREPPEDDSTVKTEY